MTKEQIKELAAHVRAGKLLREKDPEHMYVIDGDTYERLSDLATRAVEERQRLLDALKRLQWSGHSGRGHGYSVFSVCPECRAPASDSGWPGSGEHEARCTICGVLAFAKEEAK